jgi:hypothetical protein
MSHRGRRLSKKCGKSVSYYLNGPKDKLMVSKQEEQNIEVS